MNKLQSGLILIVIGIVMNVFGRLVIPFTRANPNVLTSGFMAIWMIASLVVVLFGLFRLVTGLIRKNQSVDK